MDTFGRIRSGISELRKEKEELKTKYNFLADELARLVMANGKEIKAVAEKASAGAEGLAAASEQIDRLGKSLAEAEKRLSDGISSLDKHSEDQKNAMIELSERLQRAQGAAEEAKDGVKDNRARDNARSKYVDDMRKSLGGLEAMKERISEIEKAGSLLVKGVRNLEDMRGSLAGMEERIALLGKSLEEKESGLDTKILTSIAPLKKESDSQSSAIKRLDDGIVKINLDIQSIGKDMAAERAGIARVRDSAAQNRKRLEMLGTLQSQVKNIEDIKTGLVSGVESLKGMTNKFAALEQKTRDLDARLTEADKAIDAKLDERASALDRQITAKTKDMEGQMQERLGSLQANLTEKGRTMETKLVDLSKQLEGGLSAELDGMKKEIGREIAGSKKLRLDVQKVNASIADLKSGQSGSKSGILDTKKQLSSVSARVNSLEALREKVKVIEDAKDALVAGMGDLAEVKEGLGVLDEKGKSLEGMIATRTRTLESGLQKSAGSVSSLGTDLIRLGKQVDDAKQGIAGLSAGQTETMNRVASLEKLRQKTRDIEGLEKSMAEKLREMKPVQKEVAAIRRELEGSRRDAEEADSVLDGKLDYNISSLKREAAFNAASLARMDEEIKGLSIGLRSVEKDWHVGRKDVTGTRLELDRMQKKLGDIEKLQVRLTEIEQAKEDMSTAMDSRLEQKMQFMETTLRQKGDNIEAGLAESIKAREAKLNTDIAGIRKDLAGKGRALDGTKKRLDTLSRLEERLGFIDEQKEDITRSVASLQSMQSGQAELEERGRNLDKQFKEMKSGMARDLAGLRGQVESAKTGDRNKFDSAVKAFLNTRGDLNGRMSGLDVKLDELDKRMSDFSRTLMRLDLLEKKLDRLSDQGTEMRRDVDRMEVKEESGEKVVLVDLDGEKGEI